MPREIVNVPRSELNGVDDKTVLFERLFYSALACSIPFIIAFLFF